MSKIADVIGDRPPTEVTGGRAASGKALRRDAAENRERLLAAAGQVFADQGLDAGVEDIARAAGVGMGTLYRRFPSKQALIDEIVGEMRLKLLELAQLAATRDDGTGLEELLMGAAGLQAAQAGCLQGLWKHSEAELGAITELRAILVQLLDAAQQRGRIRREIVPTDVTMVLWSISQIIKDTSAAAPNGWRRHLELLVAGLRPPGDARFAEPLAEAPLTLEQVRRATSAGR
ncbi:MAG: transcriptional regulator, TetR family protein [Frankiales bacterium]|nr:transcriptional regulator, TetR family protein [Frankiales bacterium]